MKTKTALHAGIPLLMGYEYGDPPVRQVPPEHVRR